MDNDRVGKLQAIWLRSNFLITPLLIPIADKAKDFSEWREKLGIKRITNPIIDTIKNIKEYEHETIIKHYKLTGDTSEGDVSPF